MKKASDALDEYRKYEWKKTPLVYKIVVFIIIAFCIGFIIYVFMHPHF